VGSLATSISKGCWSYVQDPDDQTGDGPVLSQPPAAGSPGDRPGGVAGGGGGVEVVAGQERLEGAPAGAEAGRGGVCA